MGSLYENPTEENIILEAKRNSEGFYPIDSLLDALESFYLCGFHDDVCGTVETGCHYYRVSRWIVQTDSQGFHEIFSHDSEKEAVIEFGKIQFAVDRPENRIQIHTA